MILAVILFVFLLAWIFIRANTNRGKHFVRAYYYLLCLKNGKSSEQANSLSRDILTSMSDADYDKRLTKMASDFSQEYQNGKQLPVIKQATSKGFNI